MTVQELDEAIASLSRKKNSLSRRTAQPSTNGHNPFGENK